MTTTTQLDSDPEEYLVPAPGARIRHRGAAGTFLRVVTSWPNEQVEWIVTLDVNGSVEWPLSPAVIEVGE
jgi:hypothetical protein